MARLIVVGGAPATGKTTLAKALAEELGVVRVSMDEIKEALFDVVGYRDRAWSKEVGSVAWPVFQRFVHLHLDRGDSIVVEATFLWPEDATWITELAAEHGVDLVQIWMTADPNTARERFIARADSGERHPGHNDARDAVMEEFESRFFNRSFIPMPVDAPTHVFDTTESYPETSDIISLLDD